MNPQTSKTTGVVDLTTLRTTRTINISVIGIHVSAFFAAKYVVVRTGWAKAPLPIAIKNRNRAQCPQERSHVGCQKCTFAHGGEITAGAVAAARVTVLHTNSIVPHWKPPGRPVAGSNPNDRARCKANWSAAASPLPGGCKVAESTLPLRSTIIWTVVGARISTFVQAGKVPDRTMRLDRISPSILRKEPSDSRVRGEENGAVGRGTEGVRLNSAGLGSPGCSRQNHGLTELTPSIATAPSAAASDTKCGHKRPSQSGPE